MKKLFTLCSVFFLTIFMACSGSDTYQGSWKAMDLNGHKYDMHFGPDTFSISDSTGKKTMYAYSQPSIEIQNSIKTYGIRLEDGAAYQIHFPKANNESVAVINDDNGHSMYSLSRKDYMTYTDIYRLH